MPSSTKRSAALATGWVERSSMARLLGGGGLGGGFRLLHAPQRSLDAVSQSSRQFRRPLRDGLRVDADGICSLGHRTAKQIDSFGFGHVEMLEHLQNHCKHSNNNKP